jgi:SAM-dependent methyltransferase
LGTEFATEGHRLALDAFRTGAIAPYLGRSPDFARAATQANAGVTVMVARKILPGLASIDIDPTGLATARAAVQAAGLGDRIEILEGDVATGVAPASADVVLMVEVPHEIAPAMRPGVVAACSRALAAGGWLVIVDETYPSTLEQTRQPEYRFPLQTGLEALMWGNVVPTREAQERLLRDAGLDGPIQRSSFGEGFTLLAVQRRS